MSVESNTNYEKGYREVISLQIRPTIPYEEYYTRMEEIHDLFNSQSYKKTINKALNILKALDNNVRLKILSYLMIVQITCLCELSNFLHIDASTMTYHISLLKKAKLIQVKKEGRSKIIKLTPNFYLLVPQSILMDLEKTVHKLRNDFV